MRFSIVVLVGVILNYDRPRPKINNTKGDKGYVKWIIETGGMEVIDISAFV